MGVDICFCSLILVSPLSKMSLVTIESFQWKCKIHSPTKLILIPNQKHSLESRQSGQQPRHEGDNFQSILPCGMMWHDVIMMMAWRPIHWAVMGSNHWTISPLLEREMKRVGPENLNISKADIVSISWANARNSQRHGSSTQLEYVWSIICNHGAARLELSRQVRGLRMPLVFLMHASVNKIPGKAWWHYGLSKLFHCCKSWN